MSNSNYIVHYGEYPLKYWINMILNREIILPAYQRDFVWSQEKVEKLVESFIDGQYIPPVVIGSYKYNEVEHNYVLDGQQRLSAILLAWLGCFPKGKSFYDNSKVFGNYNDDIENDDESDDTANTEDNIKAWKFTYIQNLISSGKIIKSEIREKLINSNNYQPLSNKIIEYVDDEFVNSKSLAFSYIRPKNIVDSKTQKRYFSTLFRNINVSAVDLTPLESRSSLYWLDENIQPFLQPGEKSNLDNIKVDVYDIDFARYMALLAQYKKQGEFKSIAKGFGGRKGKTIEQYIEKYIYCLVDRLQQDTFYIFNDDFNYEQAINRLGEVYKELSLPQKYISIIDADYYLFGLIYYTIFENKDIKIGDKEKFIRMINNGVAKAKEDYNHTKTPRALKYLRSRIESSMNIYREFI